MFSFGKLSLPITLDQQQWVDQGFLRLARLLGSSRLLSAATILPTQDHFPDFYDGSEASAFTLFERVARAMQVDPAQVDLSFFDVSEDAAKGLVPFSSLATQGAGGYYLHDPSEPSRIVINGNKLTDPMALVATLAHELGHVILLRSQLVGRDEPDMEPFNDLLTVFLGFGIFTANSAFRFQQFTDYERQGWSMSRLGYLSEQIFSYALARYALERGEFKPIWLAYLSPNIRSYFNRSAKWLKSQPSKRLLAD